MALDFVPPIKLFLELLALLLSLGLVYDAHKFLMRCLKEGIPKAMPARYLFISFSFLASSLLFEFLGGFALGESSAIFSIFSVVMFVVFSGFYTVTVADLYLRGEEE